MKTREITFRLKVPKWIPYRTTIRQIYKNMQYKLFPFRCSVTGKRLNFKYPTYEYNSPYGRVMVSTRGEVWARSQWFRYINTCFHNVVLTDENYFTELPKNRMCDCCTLDKPTIGIAENIRFGMAWWNGFKICQQCLEATIKHGVEKSGIMNYRNGKLRYLNEAGAEISHESI